MLVLKEGLEGMGVCWGSGCWRENPFVISIECCDTQKGLICLESGHQHRAAMPSHHAATLSDAWKTFRRIFLTQKCILFNIFINKKNTTRLLVENRRR